jgi:hypothetical protein
MRAKVKNTMTACLIVGFFIAAFALTMKDPAQARPFRKGVLPDKGETFGCATCHLDPAGGGPRNPFGRDYERVAIKAGDKYISELGAMDSDKDGATNDEEFAAGTHPGDPASKP